MCWGSSTKRRVLDDYFFFVLPFSNFNLGHHDTIFPASNVKYAVFTCRQKEVFSRYNLARETKLKCYCEKLGARESLLEITEKLHLRGNDLTSR